MTFGVDSSHLIEQMVKESTFFESRFLATGSAFIAPAITM